MELPPNEVIISPIDNMNIPNYPDGFYGHSFSQTESSLPDTSNIKTQKPSENTNSFLWSLLPVISIKLLLSTYTRVRSIELIQMLLSSRYLDKQQRFVLENTIISSKLEVPPSLYNIIFRHIFAAILILGFSILDFYIFLISFTLILFYLLSQTQNKLLFLFISVKPAFNRVLAEFNKFENVLDELSTALKLLTQIKIVQKATFNRETISPQNSKNLNNLKKFLTNLYSDLFFELQNNTFSFPLTDIPINQDELICTLETENIFYRIYDEVPENIQDLCISKISLDSLKMWHCLLTCQYGEYIEILAQLLDRNLQFDNSGSWVSQQMEILSKVRLIETRFQTNTLSSLTQLVSSAKLDLFALNLKERSHLPKDFSPKINSRIDSLDKIDLILQSCILKVRNLKESEFNNSHSENELTSLKFSIENTLDGIETIRKQFSTKTIKPNTTNSELEIDIPKSSVENELIIPTINPLEIPQSEEIVFEGYSIENSDLRGEIFREKEEYIETGAAQTVLKELKCVLANKQILKVNEDPSNNNQLIPKENSVPVNLPKNDSNFQANFAQNLLNIAILSSNKNRKLAQTVIGDSSSDSD